MAIQEDSLMPFGKHGGTKMFLVPAEYLLWLDKKISRYAPNKRSFNEKLVMDYINENREVLLKEIEDGKKKEG